MFLRILRKVGLSFLLLSLIHISNAGSDVRVVITVQLQRKDGNEWTTLGTWSGGSSASGSKSVGRGYQYRAYVTAKAYIGDNLAETVYKGSSSKYY